MPRSRHRNRKGRKEKQRRSLHARVLQARKLRDTHIPDTSAWNALYNDPRREDLVASLQNKVVIPTAVAISEIAATKDVAYRQGLLEFVKTVSRDMRPLASPNQLIIGACRGFARRDKGLLLNVGTEAEGSWIAINDPALVDEEAQRLAITFNHEREELFARMHDQLRVDLQRIFAVGAPRPRSVKELIRHYNRNEQFLYEAVNPIYERAVGRPLPRRRLRELLSSVPHWSPFLVGYAYAIFQRAVQEYGYRNRKNPGNLDLWSAVYLPSCEYFVTNDRGQFKALRILNRYSTRPAHVVRYTDWRARLLAP